MNDQELAELDLAVAKVEGIADAFISYDANGNKPMCVSQARALAALPQSAGPYQPTRDPAEAMRLLEKHKLEVGPCLEDDEAWECWFEASEFTREKVHGATPAIAICRAVVALKAGG